MSNRMLTVFPIQSDSNQTMADKPGSRVWMLYKRKATYTVVSMRYFARKGELSLMLCGL